MWKILLPCKIFLIIIIDIFNIIILVYVAPASQLKRKKAHFIRKKYLALIWALSLDVGFTFYLIRENEAY